ncbi:MAG: UDP-N-acetylmuramoyl-tripeptide--D-alanyl-D-alanine ligase [Candidatus Omnitrophica bacterium]|nr:UDP-N-acetylmuramoyl-tripeptide--D-alanyl-D-alanine ligase [Candidatus Omnitrophota bacterium]
MIEYTYKQLEQATRGKLMIPTRRMGFKGKVSTDTRTIQPGDLYIALKGKNYDGHDYIDLAFEKGARMCIAELGTGRRVRRRDPDIIFVENTQQAMCRLASFHRRQKNKPLIAITGSCGKTTTKEILAHLLGVKYKVLKNIGTENNIVGVPKTLLNWEDEDLAVIEIGTNQIGEIHYLTRLVQPTHGVLTLIGHSHLAGLRSIQGVRREKMSMVDAMDDNATVIYNGEDRNIVHDRLKKLKTVRVGYKKAFNFYADQIHMLDNSIGFRLNGKTRIAAPILGQHNVLNTLLAIGAASCFGIKPDDVKARMVSFEAPKGRLRYQELNGIHWIDDSYNANPSSLKAAIELFKSYPPKGRKILVLGDMLELGPQANAFHREAGQQIAGYPFDLVLTVGTLAARFAEEAAVSGFAKEKLNTFATSTDAGNYLKDKLMPADTVLLKGSRGTKMEKVMELCVRGKTL